MNDYNVQSAMQGSCGTSDEVNGTIASCSRLDVAAHDIIRLESSVMSNN